jgi:hypothetical protein
MPGELLELKQNFMAQIFPPQHPSPSSQLPPTLCPPVERLYEAGNILKTKSQKNTFKKRSWEHIEK